MTPSLAEPASPHGQRAPDAGRTAPSGDLGPVPGLRSVRAVVFDTDGVITDSARVHAAAWKVAFDACLRDFPPPDPADRRPFDTREDYRRYVDGKSRLDGAAAFLESRGLHLPAGDPGDEPGTATVRAVAARKEQAFIELLREGGIEAYPGTVRLLDVLAAQEMPCAAVSASRHARELLSAAGVLDRFEVVVDGNEAARLRLPGKPDPALFLEAARRLGTRTAEIAVVEDALAGVEAGRRSGFGLVVGVDRTAGPTSAADLREHGADLVIRDLAELTGSALAPGTGTPRTGTTPSPRTPSTDAAEG